MEGSDIASRRPHAATSSDSSVHSATLRPQVVESAPAFAMSLAEATLGVGGDATPEATVMNPSPFNVHRPLAPATATALAFPSTYRNLTPTAAHPSAFPNALVETPMRKVGHPEHTAARLASLRLDPPPFNSDGTSAQAGGAAKLSTATAAARARELTPTSSSPYGRPFPCSHHEPTNDKVDELVKKALNEADIPPGVLRFMHEQKQQVGNSPATASLSSNTATPTKLCVTPPSLPSAYMTSPTSTNIARQLSTPESTKMRSLVGVRTLPPLTLTSPVAAHPPQPPQQKQQTLPRPSSTSVAPQSFRRAETTVKLHHRETGLASPRSGSAVPATAVQSKVRGIVDFGDPRLQPSSDLGGVPTTPHMVAGGCQTPQQQQQCQLHPVSSGDWSSYLQANGCGGVQRPLSPPSAMAPDLSITQPICTTQSTSVDCSLRGCPTLLSPPGMGAPEVSSGGEGALRGRRPMAGLERSDGASPHRSFGASPPPHRHGLVTFIPPSSDLSVLPLREYSRASHGSTMKCTVERRRTGRRNGDVNEGSLSTSNTGDGFLSNVASDGVKYALASPQRPHECKRRCASTRYFRTPAPSMHSPPAVLCASPLSAEAAHPTSMGQTASATASAAATPNFTVSLAKSSLLLTAFLAGAASTGSGTKRRTQLARNMEDAPPLVRQRQQQLQQQQHAPRQASQFSLRPSPSSVSSLAGGTSLLNDIVQDLSYVDSSITTAPSQNGDLEPPLIAGVAWLDSLSTYNFSLSQATALTTLTTNYCSSLFTNSMTQSAGVWPVAALTLSERSVTRMGSPAFCTSPRSVTPRHHRRPLTAVGRHPSGFSLYSTNGAIAVPFPTGALSSQTSSTKYSCPQSSHDLRTFVSQLQQQQQQRYYHQHSMLAPSASFGVSEANSSGSSNAPVPLITDRGSVVGGTGD